MENTEIMDFNEIMFMEGWMRYENEFTVISTYFKLMYASIRSYD